MKRRIRGHTRIKKVLFTISIVLLIVAALLSPFDNPFTTWLSSSFQLDDSATNLVQWIIVGVMIAIASLLLIILGRKPLGRIITMYFGDTKDIKRIRR